MNDANEFGHEREVYSMGSLSFPTEHLVKAVQLGDHLELPLVERNGDAIPEPSEVESSFVNVVARNDEGNALEELKCGRGISTICLKDQRDDVLLINLVHRDIPSYFTRSDLHGRAELNGPGCTVTVVGVCNGDIRHKLVPCEAILENNVTTKPLIAWGRVLPVIPKVVEVRFVLDDVVADTRGEEEAESLADRVTDTVVSLVDRKPCMMRVLAVAGNSVYLITFDPQTLSLSKRE